MCAYACTCVIVSDPYYAESLGDIFRQFGQVNDSGSFLSCHEFYPDIKVSGNYLIDFFLYFGNLLICRGLVQKIIAFGLFLFYVGIL